MPAHAYEGFKDRKGRDLVSGSPSPSPSPMLFGGSFLINFLMLQRHEIMNCPRLRLHTHPIRILQVFTMTVGDSSITITITIAITIVAVPVTSNASSVRQASQVSTDPRSSPQASPVAVSTPPSSPFQSQPFFVQIS